MSKQQPYMPFFFGDFLAATATWDGEEQSLYMLLLAYQWSSGPIPADPGRIAKMCRYERKRFDGLWKTVSQKFEIGPDGFRNKRLEQHREKAAEITEKRSTSGKNGAAAKWEGTSGEMRGKTRSERLANARQIATHSKFQWLSLMDACNHSCVKCGAHKSTLKGGDLCKDHITPIYMGGSDGIENIQPMCRNCNSGKGAETIDYRPREWVERLAKLMANACHPIQSNPEVGEEGFQGGGEV